MNTYRLTNTSHTEVALGLPLLSLPNSFGASRHELFLFDDSEVAARLRDTDDAAVVAQASKIAELLRATDISYLSLREEAKNGAAPMAAEPGSLMAAILQHEQDAFSYTAAGRLKRGGWQSSTAEKQSTVAVHQASPGGPSHQLTHQGSWAPSSSPVDSPAAVKVTGIKRKEATGTKVERQHNKKVASVLFSPVKFNQFTDTIVSGLCELLDEFFERTEAPGEDEGEEAGTFLSLPEIRSIAEDVVKLRAKNLIQNVPVEYLVRLLSLLDRHVQRSHEREVDDSDDVDAENFTVVMSALESVQISLTIMTGPGMAKQIYKEELIDHLIDFSRYQIVHTIFPAYDALYRQIHKGAGAGEDEEEGDDYMDASENGVGSAKKSRRKSKVSAKPKKTEANKVSGPVSVVLHKLCSVLALLKELLSVAKILDSTLLQLIKTMLETFGVDNIQLLQLKAIGVVCMVFDVYPQHRTGIIEEIVSLLWKLPSSKRSLRSYHLPDEESKQIQMLTALILQIVQCSVDLGEGGVDSKPDVAGADVKVVGAAVEATAPVRFFEPAMDTTSYFWKHVLHRWAAPKAQDGADVRAIVENLVLDLLTTLNVPEFPAASLLLQIFCVLLFGNTGLKAKDAVVRGTSIDLLGMVAAHLKQDAVACSREKFWILQELEGKRDDDEDDENVKKNCTVCGKGNRSKVMVSCNSCNRWFHGDCIGVTKHDLFDRGWLCHCCLCRQQLASLRPDIKVQATGVKASHGTKLTQNAENSADRLAIIHQTLLNYLQEMAVNDSTAIYARRFYLCQWLRDEEQSMQTIQFFRNRCTSKVPLQDFDFAPLSRDAIFRISRALGQQRPLARGFDKILERLLVSLTENSPTPRAKALRAVSAVVEADPGVLGDERVQRAVEGRFLDSAISVREAAMELVGHHIVTRPDFAVKYFEKIAERIMDTGVSVRKRVIKIIRDVCMSNSGFTKATDGCVRIISRINDEESSIQDLVGKTFFELWFEEPVGHHTQFLGDGSAVPLDITEKVQQLVDVLRRLPSHQPMVTIIKRSLALDFCPQNTKNTATSMMTQAAVRHRCELMCKCLLESVLKVEETAADDTEICALPYIVALHAFCTVDPTLCAPPSDPARFAVTLQPYLKTQVGSRDAAQLLQSIVFVIDTVLPLLRRPPQSFVEELERDLRQLISTCSFLAVVHACIKSLCSLSKIALKGVTSSELLVRRFFKILDSSRTKELVATEKANVLRGLFCLGLLGRYGAELIDAIGDPEINMEQLLELCKFYLGCEDFDIQVRALQALGFIFIARPDFMMLKNMDKVLHTTLASPADPRLKIQMLQNFSDYLLDVEEKMVVTEGKDDKANGEKHETGNTVPVAAGAGDSNICGGIIQLHWDQILERCLDLKELVRQAALKVVEIVLRQGLTHPITCVPQLIAMEVDQLEFNSKLAHRLLMQMNEKYPSFFENRLGDGLHLSFIFIQSGAANSVQGASPANPIASKPTEHKSPAAFAKAGISRIYKLIRGSRNSRSKFMSSIIRKFDFGQSGIQAISFLLYCAEVLAALPFGLPDEPLYVVYTINRVLQVRGGELEANMKASINDGALGVVAKHVQEIMAAEKEREGDAAYDLNATAQEPESNFNMEMVEDTQGIPDDVLDKLRGYCSAAMSLALLLRLKRHLKIVYNLNDARCQAFQPNEAIKPGDMLTKRETKEFSTKELPIETPITVRQMLQQYQAFKRLLKEDSVDYATYTANIPTKKRAGRAQTAHGDTTADATHANAHTPIRSMPRRKSVTMVDYEGDSCEDESDEDWGDKARRKSAPGAGGFARGRGSKKQSL